MKRELSGEIIYLGVVLDSRKTWKRHLDMIKRKACKRNNQAIYGQRNLKNKINKGPVQSSIGNNNVGVGVMKNGENAICPWGCSLPGDQSNSSQKEEKKYGIDVTTKFVSTSAVVVSP